MRHLLSISDLTKKDVVRLLDSCSKIKENPNAYSKKFEGRFLALLFEKPSTRTRVSFEVAAVELGGHSIYLDASTTQLSRGETVEDTAKTLSRYVDVLAARVNKHETLKKLCGGTIPVINALSDLEHPCQALADLFTIKELGELGGKIVYVGDGNNVCNSLATAAEKMGLDFTVSCPRGAEPKLGEPRVVYDPAKAVEGASVIYTDVWVSMGDGEKDLSAFRPYQVNTKLISNARKDCWVMHCLPAHRGQEITDDVVDGPRSVVFQQAESHLHMQKAILAEVVK